MQKINGTLFSSLEKEGFQGRVVSIDHLEEMKEEIEGRHAHGQIDVELYQEGMSFFEFQPPEDLPNSESLIVLAVPRLQCTANFSWEGKTKCLVIPPTYLGFMDMHRKAEVLLTEILSHAGHSVAPARLPRKLLAVRSGLAEYGRNNISYVQGMGSFHQLLAYFSDLPCEEDGWREPRMMEACENCELCMNECPTNAISSERFLIHAERCLTFHNERSKEHPFPAWIDPDWHNCAVGCMLCQECCPENAEYLDKFEGSESFSEKETSLFLNGTTAEKLTDETRAKLERIGLIDFLEVMPRNLGVFFWEMNY